MAYTLRAQDGSVVHFSEVGTVTDESKKYSGKLTSYPVEMSQSGASKVSDHFQADPPTGSLRGILIGGSAVATLEEMLKKGKLLTYSGSYRMETIILTSLDFSTNSANKNGFNFSANYQKVPIVSAQFVPIGDTALMSSQDAGKSEAAKLGGKPAKEGLQTTALLSVSSSSYANYVNTFNSKPSPSTGPASRTIPVDNGYSNYPMT